MGSPFAAVHIFCSSRDGIRTSHFLKETPANTQLFTDVQEKKILARAIQIQKENRE